MNLLSAKETPVDKLSLAEMEYRYVGSSTLNVYANQSTHSPGFIFVTVPEVAAVIGWHKHNMIRSVRAFVRKNDELTITDPESKWPVLELPVWQRFFHWLLHVALAGKPLTQKARYASLLKIGPLLGIAGFEGAVPPWVQQIYEDRSTHQGWEPPKASAIEELVHSLRGTQLQGRTSVISIARGMQVNVGLLRKELAAYRALDSNIPAVHEDGSIGAFETLALLVGRHSKDNERLMTVSSLMGVPISRLPERCKAWNVHGVDAIWRMDQALASAEDRVEALAAELRRREDQLQAELNLLRARSAGLEKELNMLKAGVTNVAQQGMYGGGEGVMSTEAMRRRGFITVSEVVEAAYSSFADKEGRPYNVRLLGGYRPTRSNIAKCMGRLLSDMTLCAKGKSGERPMPKPSMTGMVVVQRIKVSDTSSGCHLVKHGTEQRSVPRVFYTEFIVPWFRANGPAAIDAWADAGYPQPE